MDCKGIFGRWFGHNYKAVYDESPTQGLSEASGYAVVAAIDLIKASRQKIYVGTICRRCGNQIGRKA